jgi:ATP-dependent protease ClpP protease subunit
LKEGRKTMKEKSGVLAIILILLFVGGGGAIFAENGELTPTPIPVEKKEEPVKWCPTTLISNNDMCMTCHVISGGKFVLKDTKPDAHVDYPAGAKILNYGTNKEAGYYLLDIIYANSVQKMFWFFAERGITHVVVEIYSYGGGLFDAWRIKGLFDEWKEGGGTIETRVYGGALSAGFMIFAAGSKGHRFVTSTAEFMWHEAQIGQWFEVTSASKEEEKARVLRHLEDNTNAWLATRGKLSKKEIDEKIAFKEFWFTGIEAVKMGFADGFIR